VGAAVLGRLLNILHVWELLWWEDFGNVDWKMVVSGEAGNSVAFLFVALL
jgi:hypothetical protein